MRTIQQQIKEIKMHSNTLQDIVNNYYMGLITMSEKHAQLTYTLGVIESIKKDIQKEYGINSRSFSLMLEL
jgi:hypothetical protein